MPRNFGIDSPQSLQPEKFIEVDKMSIRRWVALDAAYTLSLCLLASCQQLTELRVTQSGSPIPRNHREQTIFDYFHALQQKRCKEAYGLRAYSPYSSYQSAISSCMKASVASMPTKISIGRESKISKGGEICAYKYVVYAAYQNTLQLQSGEVSLVENPKKPGSCQVAYNSAFGDP
jgi:hypothetical protein